MLIRDYFNNIKLLEIFRLILLFSAVLAVSVIGFSYRAGAATDDSGGLMLKVGFVSDSGLVMFYAGRDSGLVVGDSYTVYSETGRLAVIRIDRIETNFTSANITYGTIPPEYTGKNTMVFSNSPAPSKKKPAAEIAEVQPQTTAEPDNSYENESSEPPPAKTKKKPVEEAVVTEEDDGFSTPAAQTNKSAAKKDPIYSMLVRYDAHSSGDYPDANIATVVSATKRGKNAFTTLYVLNNTDLSNRIPDYFGFGLNYSAYMSPIWSYSLGYNYQARDDVDYIPDFKTRIDTINAGLYRTIVPKTMKNSVFTGWGSFSTRANFREGRSYSGNISYVQKLKDNMRFSLSYRRLWLFGDVGYKHYSDQYGTDFSFMFKDKKITLGYFYLNREYFGGATQPDDDRNFRLTVYSSGK